MTSWYNSEPSKSWQKPTEKLIQAGRKHYTTQKIQVIVGPDHQSLKAKFYEVIDLEWI